MKNDYEIELGPDTPKWMSSVMGKKGNRKPEKCSEYPKTIVLGLYRILGLFLKENFKQGQARSRTGTDRG